MNNERFKGPGDMISLTFKDIQGGTIIADKENITRTNLLYPIYHEEWSEDFDEYPARIVLTLKANPSLCTDVLSSQIRITGTGDEINWNLVIQTPLQSSSNGTLLGMYTVMA